MYPEVVEAADRASRAAQRSFLRLNQAQLLLLAVIAFISGWSGHSRDVQRDFEIGVGLLMLAVLAISSALRVGRFDQHWFQCRAFAENAKTAVWQYVASSPEEDGKSEYLKTLGHLHQRLPEIEKDFAYNSGRLITEWMHTSQLLPSDKKSEMYVSQRLDEQIEWYSHRAAVYIRREKQWFWATFILEFVAVACAGIQAWVLWRFNIVGSIAALSAGFIAWSQTKRFSELGSSYTLAAGDLSRLRELHGKPGSDLELQYLIQRVEAAVSREHKMWLARRG